MALNRKDISTAQRGVSLEHRHFAFIAAELKASRPLANAGGEDTWRNVVLNFAASCRSTNPKFNRERFLSACGLEG